MDGGSVVVGRVLPGSRAGKGGDGGIGGRAGDIDIVGSSNSVGGAGVEDVFGWNGENGGVLSVNASPVVNGNGTYYLDADGEERLTVAAVGGSGGQCGGSVQRHPGWFGLAGDDATVNVALAP